MSDAPKCEPPEALRGVDGWHWLNGNCPVFWMADVQEWDWTEDENVGPDAAYRYGYRYVEPCTTPAEAATLREERDAAVAEVARLRAASARCPLYDAGCPNSPRPLGATSRTGRKA